MNLENGSVPITASVKQIYDGFKIHLTGILDNFEEKTENFGNITIPEAVDGSGLNIALCTYRIGKQSCKI